MSKQPKALRLAEALSARVISRWIHSTKQTPRQSGYAADAECVQAAAELRRLHAECEALRAALQIAIRQNEHDMLMTGDELRAARAALKEAK